MLGYPPVKCVNENNLDSLISELVQNEYSIYQLNGEEIYDLKTFYNQCIEILPQNPPLTKGSSVNLDAFMDSIWEGISEQESDKIAIIWTKTENIAKHNLSDLLKIRSYFKIRFTHQIMNAIRQKALYICKYRSYRTTNRR